MTDQDTLFTSLQKREPWNKGKVTGAKPPLRPRYVWSIRSRLQAEGRTRDLAMFNLAIRTSCPVIRCCCCPLGAGRSDVTDEIFVSRKSLAAAVVTDIITIATVVEFTAAAVERASIRLSR
jgi:hypothetical protein